jgi:hypothetical protein
LHTICNIAHESIYVVFLSSFPEVT